MKTTGSLYRWSVGTIFFPMSFCILAVSLKTLPRAITFALARRLFSVLIRIMGIRLRVSGREHLDPHRTRTGKLGPFKKGPFHLAKAAQATLVPFGISGLYEFQQKGGFLITPGQVNVRIGRPIPSHEYAHLSVDELRNLMFQKIQALAA